MIGVEIALNKKKKESLLRVNSTTSKSKKKD